MLSKWRHLHGQSLTALGLALLLCAPLSALAAASYTGNIQSRWSSPIVIGYDVSGAHGPTGNLVDNTATANCNLAGCAVALPGDPATTVAWGNADSSTVVFSPASFVDVALGETFTLGTLTFHNGMIGGDTKIFGATLTLSALAGDILLADPLVMNLVIVNTINDGTDAQNADLLDFGSVFGTTDSVSFNVYEGATANAVLRGRIVGDPQLHAFDIFIAPDSVNFGFIGNGVPAAIPEPATSAMFALGLAAIAMIRRRRAGRPRR